MNCASLSCENEFSSMDRCTSKFIEKKIDEAQNEITKEIEH